MPRKPSEIVIELAAVVAVSVLKKSMEKRVDAVSAPHLYGYSKLVDALHGTHGYETGISQFMTDAEYEEEILRLGYELDRGLRAVPQNTELERSSARAEGEEV